MILFDPAPVVVDQAADSMAWLIEPRAAGEHGSQAALSIIRTCAGNTCEERIEPVNWIAVFVEAKGTVACAPFHQFGWCVMVMEID